MAWIESHQELRDHPKLSDVRQKLAAEIQKHPSEQAQIIGHLHMLWWWCMDYALDGDLSKYSNQTIADAAGWKGSPDPFVKSLAAAGFIDATSKRVLVHDWFDFCGEIVHKRLRRKEEKRQKSAAIVRHIAPEPAKSAPTVPNQTVPNQTKDMRGELPPRAFDQLWERYPKKKGRIAAEKHFRKSVRSTRDWLDIQNALENYLREIRKENIDAQFVKHGSTWFFNWRDDVSYTGVEIPRAPAPKPRPPEVLPPDPTDEDLKFMHDTKIKAMGPCRDPECRYCPKVAVHV